MNPGISSLTIEGFRSLRKLDIKRLGRANLITGRNNTGKSSVLEALRILTSDAAPSVVSSILTYREEDQGDRGRATALEEADGLFQLTSLFWGFPQMNENLAPITICTKNGTGESRLTLEVGWYSRENSQDGTARLVPRQLNLFGESDEGIPALVVTTATGKRVHRMDFPNRYLPSSRYRSEAGEDARLHCIHVSPHGGEGTAGLGALWDNIALSDQEEYLVEALRIIDPEIRAVSMVGGEGPRRSRTAIVRSGRFLRPVPLRSFGDGLNRLFGIVLSLVNAKDGILLIDEFENGMHHTVQLDAWRMIYRLATELNVQVFATSHSWDAIESFQKATAESREDGVLIRLSRREDQVIPTLFDKEELAVATREGIEVR